MTDSEIEQILDECRQLRCLPENSRHRTFYEFGWFLRDMTGFLVFDKTSIVEEIAKFQETIRGKRSDYNTEDFKTYVVLFGEYWQQKPEQTAEEFEKDLQALRRASRR